MLMAFVGREQFVPSPSSRTCNSTAESSFIFSNSGTAKVALCLVCRVTGEVGSGTGRLAAMRPYSAIMRSAHSTRETKMAGLPNFALQLARSFSETPRAREQAPQENTGMCLATIFSRNSLSGGQPMGITASDVALRIRYVASAVRNIWTS